jgi:hypothetical protein
LLEARVLRRPAGCAQSGKLERHLLGHDLLRREPKQRSLIIVGEWNLDHLSAFTADGEGELAVAGAMTAGDEGCARLEPVPMPFSMSSASAR